MSLSVEGGDTGPLSMLTPQFDESDSGAFQTWQSGVMTNPAVIGFTLKPLWELATPDGHLGMKEALDAYTAEMITLSSIYQVASAPDGDSRSASSMIVGSMSIQPTPAPIPPEPVTKPANDWISGGPWLIPASSIFVGVVDRFTDEVYFAQTYYVPRYGDPQRLASHGTLPRDHQPPWDAIWSELEPAVQGKSDYIVGFVGNGLYATSNFPSPALEAWLQQHGATLQAWRDYYLYTGGDEGLTYLFIGFSNNAGLAVEGAASQPVSVEGRTLSCSLSTPKNYRPSTV